LEGVDVAEEEGIPEQVASFLSSILPPGEEAFYFAQADIDEEGKFGERWLFITKEKIDVLNPVTKHVSQFPLSSVSSSTVRDYLGNAELIIETKEGSEGIIRFSRVHLDEFHNAARLIDKIAKQEVRLNDVDVNLLNSFLIKKNGFKKSQTLKWLLGHVKPHLHFTILTLFLSLMITAVSLTPPYLMKNLVDDVFVNKNVSSLLFVVTAFIAIYAGNTVLGPAQSYTLAYLG
jgi:hypothetical protein